MADYATTPSVATADKDATALGAVLADTLTTMAQPVDINVLYIAAALSEAGFGQITRSATALAGDSSGPAPGMIELELRTGLAE